MNNSCRRMLDYKRDLGARACIITLLMGYHGRLLHFRKCVVLDVVTVGFLKRISGRRGPRIPFGLPAVSLLGCKPYCMYINRAYEISCLSRSYTKCSVQNMVGYDITP